MSTVANICTRWVESPALSGLSVPLMCHMFGHAESTTQKLKLHMFRKHCIKDIIRLYVDSTHCPVCLKQFSERECLLNHVKRGRTPCKQQLLLRGPRLTHEEADAIDLDLRQHFCILQRQGLRRHAKTMPCMQLRGPRLPTLYGPVQPS